jgi:hypothetical protein
MGIARNNVSSRASSNPSPILTGEQQFAEKLHAYTLPRSNMNTRVKDLVDMVLLFESGKLNALATAEAFKLTFERRSTHEIPLSLPAPRPTGTCHSTRWPASVESRRAVDCFRWANDHIAETNINVKA